MKKIFFVLTVLITAFLTSCQVDVLENLNSGNGMNEKGFSLSYRVEGAFSGLTKSSVSIEKGEDRLNSFYILFFENTSGGTGLFVDAVEVKSTGSAPLRNSGRVNILFPEDSDLTNTEDYKLILCANIEDYSNFNDIDALRNYCRQQKLTEEEAVHLLLNISGVEYEGDPVKEQTDNRNSMSMSNIPMSASLVKKAGDTTLTVELIRIVSRFDVSCEAAGYELVSASIWNAMTSTTLVSSIFNDYSTERTERYYGVSATNNKIVGSLYAFENYVRNPVQNDKRTTCLIIGLRKDGKSNVEYFRTNMNEIQNFGHQIKRNNAYRIAIKNISNRGESTERGAYENPDNFIYYLELNPNSLPEVSWMGDTTEKITVESNGRWTAVLNITGGNAGFNGDVSLKTISGENGGSFTVTFNELTTNARRPLANILVTLDDKPEVQKTLMIYQESVPAPIMVCSNTFGVAGVLTRYGDDFSVQSGGAATKRNSHNYYVYNLGQNMRNNDLFGTSAESQVRVPGGFEFKQAPFSTEHLESASIYQVMNAPSVDEFQNVKKAFTKYDNKLLMFTDNNYASGNQYLMETIKRYKTVFGNDEYSNYTFTSLSLDANISRYVHPTVKHPLMDYLLKEGPFTNSNFNINREDIELKAYGATHAGLLEGNWPETFVPIIMSRVSNKVYCVFGIDPVTRLIWMTDPGIFGTNQTGTTFYNKVNYTADKPENVAFLNNFIAWMAYVTMQGNDFLEQFQVKPGY